MKIYHYSTPLTLTPLSSFYFPTNTAKTTYALHAPDSKGTILHKVKDQAYYKLGLCTQNTKGYVKMGEVDLSL